MGFLLLPCIVILAVISYDFAKDVISGNCESLSEALDDWLAAITFAWAVLITTVIAYRMIWMIW